MARARRWVGRLCEMEMRCTSEVVGVRWGRDEGGGLGEEGEGEGDVGGGVFGGVVEMERVGIVGVMAGERRWKGMLLVLKLSVKTRGLFHTAAVERTDRF